VKVSVVMITYNHERYIAQAIQSVLDQQVDFPIELIVGDDASTDGAPEIIRRFQAAHPQVIRARLATVNQGAFPNFRQCFEACRGQYIALLEGDDYWTSPHKLRRQVEAMDRHPDWAVCFHRVHCISEEAGGEPRVFPPGRIPEVRKLRDILKANFIQTCSVMYRAGLVRDFPPDFPKLALGDWPLHILHALQGDIGFIDDVMAVYREHTGGMWSTRPVAWRIAQTYRMFQVMRPVVNRALGSRQVMYQRDLDDALAMIKMGYPAVARGYVGQCLRVRPWQPYCWRLFLRSFRAAPDPVR
jgi:glycosyltransferase involved in cell wall biosynthesis